MPLENGQPYDVRDHHDVFGSLIERAKTSLNDDQRVLINAACKNLKFWTSWDEYMRGTRLPDYPPDGGFSLKKYPTDECTGRYRIL